MEPHARIRKYKKLPDEVKQLAFRMHHFGFGYNRIAKMINTDPRIATTYVGDQTVQQLLHDSEEEAKFRFIPTF